ncbi:MAG: AAA family ATPase, partial [Solobacterium sp.]|nr:AAA family ATPase [Solobacterium sp.]
RVLLARALCAAEEVLLLDEPVTGLDPRVSAELYALIRQLNAGGITILMISHDIASAVRDASHILHIGQKVFFGTAEEYRTSRIGRYFLEAEGSEEE